MQAAILAALQGFSEGTAPLDDVTLAVLEYRPIG
jgi:hypothetical protein